MAAQTFIAIEIGGTKLQLVVGNELLACKEKIRLPIDKSQGAAGIRRQIEKTLADMGICHILCYAFMENPDVDITG